MALPTTDPRNPARSETQQRTTLLILVGLALARLLLHLLANVSYGYHRDELAVWDDARHLAWGYVAYPPLTRFLAHVSMLTGRIGGTDALIRAALAFGEQRSRLARVAGRAAFRSCERNDHWQVSIMAGVQNITSSQCAPLDGATRTRHS